MKWKQTVIARGLADRLPQAVWEGPILFYDASCLLCSSLVAYILRHDRRGTLSFARLDGPLAAALRGRDCWRHPVDSMVWFEADPMTLHAVSTMRSTAVVSLARYLGGPWAVIANATCWLPPDFRDQCYDLVAKWRFRLRHPPSSCRILPPHQRARVLEMRVPPEGS